MSKFFFINFIFVFLINIVSFPVFARCAICYTQGMSGASIAVIVIIFSFFALFLGNKLLKKFLEKYNL